MAKNTTTKDQMYFFWKVVEGALKNDTAKVRAYAEHLAAKFQSDGDEVGAYRLNQLLAGSGAQGAALQKAAGDLRRLPTDGESRLPVADEERWAPGTVPLILNDGVGHGLQRFLRHFRASDRLLASGVPISPSLLLHGPPGTGKTQIARFIAADLGLPLVVSRSDALISSYLGSTAKNVRLLFDHAASRPCVLFLDEVDALAKKRDDGAEVGELKRVVIGLLQNIDALGRDHVLIAATNHPHLLDSAVWRRFAYHVEVELPHERQRAEMLHLFLAGKLTPDELQMLAAISEGLSGAKVRQICEDVHRESILESSPPKLLDLIDQILIARGVVITPSYSPAEKVKIVAEISNRKLNQRMLARAFGLSQPYISKALNKVK